MAPTSVLGTISATTSALTRRSMKGPSTACSRASWCLSRDMLGPAPDVDAAPPGPVPPCTVHACMHVHVTDTRHNRTAAAGSKRARKEHNVNLEPLRTA